jgi:hypothetical protein
LSRREALLGRGVVLLARSTLIGTPRPCSANTRPYQTSRRAVSLAFRSTVPGSFVVTEFLPQPNYGAISKSGHAWLPKPNVTTANQITNAVTPKASIRTLSHISKGYCSPTSHRQLYVGISRYRSAAASSFIVARTSGNGHLIARLRSPSRVASAMNQYGVHYGWQKA